MGSPRYNWEAIRERYVTGEMDLRSLAAEPGMPNEATIMRWSAKEDWPGQRRAYRQHVASKTRDRVATESAEVAARHVRMAKAIQGKGLQALQHIEPERLTPYQALRFLKLGTDLERAALALDESGGDLVELGELTLEQLRRIAAGEDPARVARDE